MRRSLRRTHERAHALPFREQRPRDRGAEEAVRAGDEIRRGSAHAGDADRARAARTFNHAGSAISVNAMLTQSPIVSITAHARGADVRREREHAEARDDREAASEHRPHRARVEQLLGRFRRIRCTT